MEGTGEVWEAVYSSRMVTTEGSEQRREVAWWQQRNKELPHLSDITVCTDTWSTSRQDKIYYGRPSDLLYSKRSFFATHKVLIIMCFLVIASTQD